MRHTVARSLSLAVTGALLSGALTAPTTLLGQIPDQTGTLVVVNKGAAAANLIDLATGTLVATLPTGDGPHEVAISADGRTAVVTDYGGQTGGNTLTVIDVPGMSVARTIDLGDHRRPHGIAFLPGDSLVVVTSEASGMVVVVRVADGRVVRAVPTQQGGSHMLALVGEGRRLYTSNIRDGTVSQLDMQAGRYLTRFSVPEQPEAIGITPDGAEVWVGSNARGTVSVLDPTTGATEEALHGFGWPYRIFVTPDNRRVLIPDLRGNTLRVFDRATREQVGELEFAGAGPQGITLSADGRIVFLALSQKDQVAAIDLETLDVVGYLRTGARPDGVAYSRVVLSPSPR